MAKEKAVSKTVVSMPTPVTILWDNILMLPVVGIVDSKRAQEIMETILAKILETEAKFIILDILGTVNIDSAVANHLIKITKATKLMGCDCIITGISPSIAQTLVHLGVELKDIITRATLKDGLQTAFDALGVEIKEAKEAPKKRGG